MCVCLSTQGNHMVKVKIKIQYLSLHSGSPITWWCHHRQLSQRRPILAVAVLQSAGLQIKYKKNRSRKENHESKNNIPQGQVQESDIDTFKKGKRGMSGVCARLV